jgi:hypothetical protein
MQFDLFGFLRTLSFGGLLVSMLMGVVFIVFAPTLSHFVTLNFMLAFGGLLGAGASQWIDSFIMRGMLRPFGHFIAHYTNLAQLVWHRKMGLISERQFNELRREMVEAYFLGGKDGGRKQLPSGP